MDPSLSYGFYLIGESGKKCEYATVLHFIT